MKNSNFEIRISNFSRASASLCSNRQRGATTVYFVLFTFAIFGLMVMATDVGRMYVIQGELQAAADAAALAAATRLTGTANALLNADDRITTSFDSTTGNDNRFNLRLNQITEGGTGLVTTRTVDYFSTLLDARANTNGGQSGAIDWTTGLYPKYVRVEITAQAPAMFGPLINRTATTLPNVVASAVAGISAPICSACGIEGFAIPDQSAGADTAHYGLTQGAFYTLYLSTTQRAGAAAAPLAGTIASIPYVVLDHIPGGPADLGLDSALFQFGATGLSASATASPPGLISIDGVEVSNINLPSPGTTTGQNILCGLNTRFGVDPQTNNCGTLFTELAPLFSADSDLGASEEYAAGAGLQDFAVEYDGNFRRVITVPVIDAVDTLTVLNFRQFLIVMSAPTATLTQGLNTALATGAFRAQYIGAVVPVRCGGVGGMCTAASGVGRVVLH